MAKRFPNIYLEMSGMPMGVKIRQAYEEVGHDRIMFGTDYPFHHPSVEIQKVLTCGLDEAAMQDVFYNNAKSCSANKNSSAPDRRSGALYTVGKLRRVP